MAFGVEQRGSCGSGARLAPRVSGPPAQKCRRGGPVHNYFWRMCTVQCKRMRWLSEREIERLQRNGGTPAKSAKAQQKQEDAAMRAGCKTLYAGARPLRACVIRTDVHRRAGDLRGWFLFLCDCASCRRRGTSFGHGPGPVGRGLALSRNWSTWHASANQASQSRVGTS